MSRWTPETIENELRNYRANKCRMRELEQDIAALEALPRDDSIAAAALPSGMLSGMPHGTGVNKPVERLVSALPDENEQILMRAQLNDLRRHISRVDAWIESCTHRERLVLRLCYVEGMNWSEIAHAYNQRPTDGNPREERAVQRWRRNGLARITETLAG